jgi:hypothetical protein
MRQPYSGGYAFAFGPRMTQPNVTPAHDPEPNPEQPPAQDPDPKPTPHAPTPNDPEPPPLPNMPIEDPRIF